MSKPGLRGEHSSAEICSAVHLLLYCSFIILSLLYVALFLTFRVAGLRKEKVEGAELLNY